MNQREKIAQILKDDPSLRQRKFRYILVSRITGVEPEICKQIASVLDEYRHMTAPDPVGLLLEKEYHASPSFWGEQARQNKKLQDDLLKYA
jgi:hypothetical protein